MISKYNYLGTVFLGFILGLGMISCSQPADSHLNQIAPQPTPIAQSPSSTPTASSDNIAKKGKKTPPANHPPKPPVASKGATKMVNPKLIQANTQFGFQLFQQLLKQDEGKNIFMSPSSIAIALGMTYNGAAGETKSAMAKMMAIQNLTLQDFNQANEDLNNVLESRDAKVELTIANSLWARQEFSFNTDFLQRNQKFYKAKVSTLDFNNPESATTINNWVRRNTKDKIEKIVDRLQSNDVMFLINAIYFKGKWTMPFDKALTQTKPFKLANGASKSHPLMAQQGEYRYLETDQFQAVSLPYGDRNWSFYVFLPKPNSSLQQFSKDWTASNWDQWMKQFAQRDGSLQIPKFKLEYSKNLKEPLSAIGMANAFELNQANFSNLANNPVAISDVKHKTFVEVNEEGTEAAAVTSVGIVATSVQINPTPPFQMVVDRPFLCVIRDNQSGAILFMGAIVDPT
ncbi:MAG: serpin family protein [Synechococcales bacterium]|nr:serpin family protein [Synechococcales bacterium]